MKNYLRILCCLMIISLLSIGCTQRQASRRLNHNKSNRERVDRNSRGNREGAAKVKMRQDNGVYYVPCKINEVEMEFVFDTGASDVTISLTEALFLYKQKKISDDDVVGAAYYQIADGSVAEGTVINLKSVTIGGRTVHNVKASIVHNMDAPLLLGQSVLSKFGTISIDYKRMELVLD